MRIVSKDGKIGEPLAGLLPVGQGGTTEASKLGGLPPITARGQGGLLDVALSPNFNQDSTIFWSFSEERASGSGTSVARGKLSRDRTKIEDAKVIFRVLPSYNNGLHFGSRLAFGPDGKLYITDGDRFDRPNRELVQKLDNHLGKIRDKCGRFYSRRQSVRQNGRRETRNLGFGTPQCSIGGV